MSSRELNNATFVSGASLPLAGIFTAAIDTRARFQFRLRNAIVRLRFYKNENDLKADLNPLLTLSTSNNTLEAVLTESADPAITGDVLDVSATVSPSTTSLWSGRIHYQWQITTNTGEKLIDPSYKGVFQEVKA